jgi:hypothetical protein
VGVIPGLFEHRPTVKKKASTEFIGFPTNGWRYTTLVKGKTLTVYAMKAYKRSRYV